MSETIANNPEKRETVADNARKFIVDNLELSSIVGDDAVSFRLITDWLVTDEDSEEKVVRKEFSEGGVQTLRITKTTEDGKRSALREEISLDEYERLIGLSLIRVEKMRHEFILRQYEGVFDIKYDEFAGSNNLRILEVDAVSEEMRDAFDITTFPADSIAEVANDRGYEGYRVSDKI